MHNTTEVEKHNHKEKDGAEENRNEERPWPMLAFPCCRANSCHFRLTLRSHRPLKLLAFSVSCTSPFLSADSACQFSRINTSPHTPLLRCEPHGRRPPAVDGRVPRDAAAVAAKKCGIEGRGGGCLVALIPTHRHAAGTRPSHRDRRQRMRRPKPFFRSLLSAPAYNRGRKHKAHSLSRHTNIA